MRRFIAPGSKILDIGSTDGALFRRLGPTIGTGSLGVDPTLTRPLTVNGCELLPGYFPDAIPSTAGTFDVITLLAVLEHFPPPAYGALSTGCQQLLRPGGKLLITVPLPQVDTILAALQLFYLVDGMSLQEHHGYEVSQTPDIFPPPAFQLERRESFQLGLNHLFVFTRTSHA